MTAAPPIYATTLKEEGYTPASAIRIMLSVRSEGMSLVAILTAMKDANSGFTTDEICHALDNTPGITYAPSGNYYLERRHGDGNH